MSAQQLPRTGTYRMADTLPTTASDSAFYDHYAYLIKRNPSWALGLKRPDGSLYYTPTPSILVSEKKAVAA